jgi:hypothetical protein
MMRDPGIRSFDHPITVPLSVTASTMTVGIILAVVGLLPLVAGLVDVCVFAPLFGAPFSGAKVRAMPDSEFRWPS